MGGVGALVCVCVCLHTVSFFFIGVMVAAQGLGYMM